jgi:hypothetical protein
MNAELNEEIINVRVEQSSTITGNEKFVTFGITILFNKESYDLLMDKVNDDLHLITVLKDILKSPKKRYNFIKAQK